MPISPVNEWELEHFQRNAISRGLMRCKPDDLIIISDADEIPRASSIRKFNGDIAVVEQDFFYYKFNCKCIAKKWRRF